MLKDVVSEEAKPYSIHYEYNGIEDKTVVISRESQFESILAERSCCKKEDIKIIRFEELNNEEVKIKSLTIGDLLRLFSVKEI